MKRWTFLFCVAILALALSAPAAAGPAGEKGVSLDQYKVTVNQAVYRDLQTRYDVVSARHLANGRVTVDLVLARNQVSALRADGLTVSLRKNKFGLSARQFAAAQAVNGFNVWRDYDGTDGLRAWMYAVARRNPQLVKLEVIGQSVKDREIIALKVTQAANEVPDGSRPAVLYTSTQHAREWITPEVNRRLAAYLISQWRANNKAIKNLLKENELWFVLVANPDGYQYTHSSDDTRLWRKTLRDNNNNGTIEVGDGVDPNRNYPEHWGYDNEGSSPVQSSDTYRGPDEESEPETQAITGLYDRIDFAFHVNWHSAGQWLLYPEGWQIGTPTADDPIYFALSGNLDNPAIEDFQPGISSDVLYVTNGETTDFAHSQHGTLAWTPELSEGCDGCGFVFPDDDELVQEEFERNLPFALDVAKSASDPDDPVSHLGLETKPFYLKSDDTYKTGLPLANFTFDISYGDPQEVRVLAKRSLGAVTLKYSINGGDPVSKPTTEWEGGEKYGGETDVYYHVMTGEVTGTSPGDSVEVWFEGGGETSDSFTYSAQVESDNRVLILVAEDYTGQSPGAPHAGPEYLDYYQDALEANDVEADVYDVDSNGRRAADSLGILSHYDAVIWETGRDSFTRTAGAYTTNQVNDVSRLGMDGLLEAREYLNEGGRVMYAGELAGAQFTTVLGVFGQYDPTAANARCSQLPAGTDPRRCLFAFGSPQSDLVNDVIEYWFGAFLFNLGAGNSDEGFFPVVGTGEPFTDFGWNPVPDETFFGFANSFITTGGILSPEEFPQFDSWPAAQYDRPGGPFAPHSGEGYAYSQIADVSYKRLTRTVDVPADGGEMTFWTSYNTEATWDFVFVEAHTLDGTPDDDWTTLPDVNGHTSQSTGSPCPKNTSNGWRTLHPWLDHYQTQVGNDTCTPTGTTGAWNAASGDSHGWQQWEINLDDYAGEQIEISIAYASDWASQGLGVFVDDVVLPDGTNVGFETDLEGFDVPGQPAGSAPNVNDWIVTDAAGFPEAAVVATPDTLYFGHGLEAVPPEERAAVMERAVEYLLRP